MLDEPTNPINRKRGIGSVLGTITCLREMGKIGEIRSWVAATRQMSTGSGFFHGYRFALETLIRLLHNEISHNQSLELTEDDVLCRANFVGKPMWLVPNSSEKSVLLRNIATFGQPILRARSWRALEEAMSGFSAQVLEPFERLEQASRPNPPAQSILEGKRIAAMFQLYIFLNDTRRGLPHGYFGHIFETDNTTFRPWLNLSRSKEKEPRFRGYKLAVQFSWSQLLAQSFQESPAVNLHLATDWQEFDSFFDKLGLDVIAPIEKSAHDRLSFNDLLELEGPAKRTLGDLITNGPPERELTDRDLIDRAFLWYNLHVLDGSESHFVGVPAFIRMLLGSADLQKQDGSTEKLRVIKLIHGEAESHRRDYSFAILIESYGTISDSSGWILYYDCCSDQGSTSQFYADAVSLIDHLVDEGQAQTETLEVDKRKFLEMMNHRFENISREQLSGMRANA